MRQDRDIALHDVFTALVGGDAGDAAEAIATLGVDPFERLLSSAVVIDLGLPMPDTLALAEQAGSWAVPPLVKLLSANVQRVVDANAAAVLLGPPAGPGPTSRRLRQAGTVLILRPQAVRHLVAVDFPDVTLTPVELRILFLLIAGLDLRELATLDGVGYETRRGQFKALAAKLGTPRQIDLVRMLLGRLLVLLGRTTDTVTRHAAFFRETGDRRFGGGRPFVLHGPDGVELRAVEIGPGRGPATIVLHPQAWPLMTGAEAAAFESEGLRTLWPLRHGALAPGVAPISLDSARERSIESIRVLHEMFCDGPVPLVGLISGAPFAIDAVRAMPDRFSSLTIVGACHSPNTAGNGAGALRRGLYWMARRNPGFLSMALRMMATQMARPGAYAKAILHHYAESPADLAIVSRTIRERLADRMQARYAASLPSIRNDFLFQSSFDWSVVHDLPVPVQFIHGAEDPVHPLADIRALAARGSRATVDVIPDAGQLLLFEHLIKVIGLLPGPRPGHPDRDSGDMRVSRGTPGP
jgi:pimeloyl-ACP methyl ester carboxylesterase/DNA-binding CsgD family transcriptional regulator